MYGCLPHNFTSINDEYNKLDPLTWQTYLRETFHKQSNESKSLALEYFKCLRINWMVQSFQLHGGNDRKKNNNDRKQWMSLIPLLAVVVAIPFSIFLLALSLCCRRSPCILYNFVHCIGLLIGTASAFYLRMSPSSASSAIIANGKALAIFDVMVIHVAQSWLFFSLVLDVNHHCFRFVYLPFGKSIEIIAQMKSTQMPTYSNINIAIIL